MAETKRTRALILVVDDSATQAMRAAQSLEAAGFRVRLAANGRHALDEARRWRPDAIVSDVLMPTMDGFALCREVRRDPVLAATPVVLHTITYVDPKDEEFARALGATRFLIKPSDPAELIAEVRAALEVGHVASGRASAPDDEAFLSGYSERLAAKLEDKVAELEEAYRRLERQSEEALRQGEERYRYLVDHATDIIYSTDPRGRITYVNPPTRDLLGYRPEELIGRHYLELIRPDFRAAAQRFYRRQLASRTASTYLEVPLIGEAGQEVWIGQSVQLVAHEADLKGFQAIARDITERRRAEAERAMLTAAIERERATLAAVMSSMSDGLIVAGTDGQIRYCNAQVEKILGPEVMPLVGLPVDEFVDRARGWLLDPDGLRSTLHDAFARVAEYPSFEIGLRGPPRRDVVARLFPVLDPSGVSAGLGILLHDVTLERDLARTKDELVAVVSHELRTPLASIVGFAELLLLREFPEAEQQEFLQIMLEEGRRLTALINDFLDLQRLESGRQRLAPTPIALGPLLERAVAAAGPDPERPISIGLADGLPPVLADQDRVLQVLTNLLSNARKYSPDGGAIVLGARPVGSTVEVSVTDRGLGIPEEALPHLFERFYRVDNSDRRQIKGTGLGLAICAQIVSAHGGRIWAESCGLGQGARLAFTLPQAHAGAAAGDVLVVEDDAGFARLMVTELAAVGLTSVHLASVAEAVAYVQQSPPRAIVLDLLLAEGSGEDLLPRLRALDQPAVPVVVVTVQELEADERAFLERQGASMILNKGPGVAAAAAAAVHRLVESAGRPVAGGQR